MRYFLILYIFLLTNCTESRNQNVENPSQTFTSVNTKNDDTELPSKGVITVGESFSREDTVKIYDQDGALWYKFTFFYDDSDGKFDYPNKGFQPFAFHPDNFLLVLVVVSENEDRYEVVVNEGTGLKKFIKKGASGLMFQTWEEHIVNVFAVDFDPKSNPIFADPLKGSAKINYDNNEYYYPVKVKDNWLQIRWGEEGDYDYGWIMWKYKKKLLIELSYFA